MGDRALEQRIDRLERKVDRIEESIGNLHNTSMAFVTESFATMERRLMAKIEANAEKVNERIDAAVRSSSADRLLMFSGAFGWIVTIGIVILTLVRK